MLFFSGHLGNQSETLPSVCGLTAKSFSTQTQVSRSRILKKMLRVTVDLPLLNQVLLTHPCSLHY